MALSSIFSVSCASSVLMALYITMAGWNLYRLMYPLSQIDLKGLEDQPTVKSLWDTASEMHMRVYLSTESRFTLDFLESDFPSPEDASSNKIYHKLLWDEKLDSPAFSKSFLLTSLDCDNVDCEQDESFQFASDWLDHAENTAIERGEGGVLATLQAAGHGIESTSALLTLYQWFGDQIHSVLVAMSLRAPDTTTMETKAMQSGILGRTMVLLPRRSPMWKQLQSNSTLYLHVFLINTEDLASEMSFQWPPSSLEQATSAIRKASSTNAFLAGQVNMIKYEPPHHIGKPKRILFHDLIYLFRKYILQQSNENNLPPWEMAITKPEEYKAYQQALTLKEKGAGYPYWKPEVSIKYVNDDDEYPRPYAHVSGMPLVHARNNPRKHPTGVAFLPAMHVDEMGMTSEKYIPVNETLTSLPLRISFDRSDLEHHGPRRTTATAGGMSPARWRLLSHLSQAIEAQKQMGFEQSDIDDVKRLIADTNITLLAITLLASALHLLFEFLTFKSEVSFWRKNDDLTGLSVRSLFLDMIGQSIILLFLIEEESSLLTTVPSGIGCLIALWKCQRGAGLQFVRRTGNTPVAWWNWLPSLVGYELRATRLEARNNNKNEIKTHAEVQKDKLISMTIESDRIATRYLGAVLLPLAFGYALYSFLFKEHRNWYSWAITSLASAVYALGFVLMTPQLFLNWKLKSVAHLPWRVLIYKSLNTFIDDLFSFIIRMPTMARISCFRDDVVFFIYLYQRWLYPVDASRPVEGGGEGAAAATTVSESNGTEESSKEKAKKKKTQ